jgi:hypothetical protein
MKVRTSNHASDWVLIQSSCKGTIVEGVDALKGAIRPLSLDCPLIAVTEDNVKDRLLRALGHPNAIRHKNDSLETIR